MFDAADQVHAAETQEAVDVPKIRAQAGNGWRRGQTYQGDLIARYSLNDVFSA